MKQILFRFFKKSYDWFNAKWVDGKCHATSVVIDSDLGKNTKVGKHSFFGNSSLGDYSYLSGFNIVVNTTIGKFCSIGSFVSICTGSHPTSVFASTSPVFYAKNPHSFADQEFFKESGTVQIGHDVWIGSNVVIVDNVTIGTGVIIAAGAVVVNDVPPYAIIGGVPAKLIRMRFDDTTIAALLASNWWEKDETWFRENYKLMHNAENLLNNLAQEA